MDERPFPHLRITSSEFLDEVQRRELCSCCSRSRKYFCYTCNIPLPSLADRLPKVKLPYRVHVIKHRQEVCGKSTAVHAAILAPADVSIHIFPDIPVYDENLKVVLVCPGVESITLQQYMTSEKNTEIQPCDGPNRSSSPDVVVYIDSTWNQVHGMLGDPRLSALQRIELKSERTKFWRHQMDKPATYLSTIEAIYYTAREHYDCIANITSGNRGHADSTDLAYACMPDNSASCTAADCLHVSDSHFLLDQSDSVRECRPTVDESNTISDNTTTENKSALKMPHQVTCGAGVLPRPYDGRYDDLLFFFSYYYTKIGRLCEEIEPGGNRKTLKAYHSERRTVPRLVQR